MQSTPNGLSMRPLRRKSRVPTAQDLAEILSKSSISLSRHQLDQLWRYHNLLRKRNQDRDLTRLVGFESMAVKHYVDCLYVAKLASLPSPIIDVGTGAGFPGIPLKILLPSLEITLAEPRPRRAQFLRDAVKELGLKGVEVFDHKVVSASFKRPVQAVITRALETMDKTILRTSACLVPGGRIYFMKGPNADAEIKDVKKRFFPKYKLVQDKAYQLPHTPFRRRLVVWERVVNEPKTSTAKA